jgi:hypothetical protein
MIEFTGGIRPSGLKPRRHTSMKKKIMGMMLGVALVTGAVSIAFAATTPSSRQDEPKKKKKKKTDRSVVETHSTVR